LGRSPSPTPEQPVHPADSRSGPSRSRHMAAQGPPGDRWACRTIPRHVEAKHAPAELAHGCLAGQEVKAERITEVAIRRNILVERVVLAGINADNRRAC